VFPSRILGKVRVRAEPTNSSEDIFVGIARSRDVDRYLGDVPHATIRDFFDNDVKDHPGDHPPDGGPQQQTFWVAAASGNGSQSVVWDVASGSWSIVVMNTDGSKGVAVRTDIAATVPALRWVAIGLLIAGVILLLGGVALIVGASKRVSRHATE
jgi:hypothetical protein